MEKTRGILCYVMERTRYEHVKTCYGKNTWHTHFCSMIETF